jgi:hypothetical protein
MMFSLNAFSSFRLAVIAPLVSILVLSNGIRSAQALEVGEQFCVEGFVMDRFCIDRGTLLDRQSVRTLEGPDQHSVHCLVDVGRCVATNFEILLDPLPGGSTYARGWLLDDATKGRVIELAQSIGSCSTCENREGLVRGMRAALQATVLDLGSSSTPPTISATDIQQSELGVNFCFQTPSNTPATIATLDDGSTVTTMVDGTIVTTMVNGTTVTTMVNGTMVTGDVTDAPTGGFVMRRPPNRITSAGIDLNKKYYAHASCMLIGFGWLLPMGAVFARLFKHRPNSLWFKIHVALQVIGLIFAIAGWVSTAVVRVYE